MILALHFVQHFYKEVQTQKFSLVSLIIIATIIFFLDVYGFNFMKPIRSIINDGIYRVSLVASSPSRFLPSVTEGVTNLFKIKSENARLKEELEIYKKRIKFRIFKQSK